MPKAMAMAEFAKQGRFVGLKVIWPLVNSALAQTILCPFGDTVLASLVVVL